MINRQQAFTLIKKYLKEKDNIKTALVVEKIMMKMAKLLEKDEELWGLTGLLHNLDYEYSAGSPENRGVLAAQLLDGLLPENGVNAIKANNYMHTDYIPTTSLDKSLIIVVTGAGLIITVSKSIPSKKISDVDLALVIVKFHDSNFASRYNRNRIYLCEDLGMQLEFFLDLCLNAIKEIYDQNKL
jgi:predicted hydrolase (HD superfamily)